jgi:endogenous inhibitor of DNA gyrase (YacG/DUF329 family)
MTDTVPCPICGGPVPMTIDESGPDPIERPPPGQVAKYETECPNCNVALERPVTSDDPGWQAKG